MKVACKGLVASRLARLCLHVPRLRLPNVPQTNRAHQARRRWAASEGGAACHRRRGARHQRLRRAQTERSGRERGRQPLDEDATPGARHAARLDRTEHRVPCHWRARRRQKCRRRGAAEELQEDLQEDRAAAGGHAPRSRASLGDAKRNSRDTTNSPNRHCVSVSEFYALSRSAQPMTRARASSRRATCTYPSRRTRWIALSTWRASTLHSSFAHGG